MFDVLTLCQMKRTNIYERLRTSGQKFHISYTNNSTNRFPMFVRLKTDFKYSVTTVAKLLFTCDLQRETSVHKTYRFPSYRYPVTKREGGDVKARQMFTK